MGPLKGIKCVEVGGIGPAPFCGMMLADMGAEVLRIERKGYKPKVEIKYDILLRGRKAIIGVDLKKPQGVQAVRDLINGADVVYEGFRPGVMEKLGLGSDECLAQNPKLVYGRVTGWGREGPLSQVAGHDINYIALSGVLHAVGRPGEKPVPPINMLGDWAGGAMLLAFGIVSALLAAEKTGKGQVVDTAMVDGSALLLASVYGLYCQGQWKDERGTNLLDGGAHFYDTYETADGKYIAIGSLEPQFYALLLKYTGLDGPEFETKRMDPKRWPKLKEKMAAVFKTKTRDEWCAIMEGTDTCFAPVLSLGEAIENEHLVARNTFTQVQGVTQPAPAPRFSRTPPEIQNPPPVPFENTEAVLNEWGLVAEVIEALKSADAIEL